MTTRACSESETARAVLRLATGRPDAQIWRIDKPEAGRQANLVRVSSTGEAIWRNHRKVIVKIFRSPPVEARPQLDRQFESLSVLYAALNGRCVDGWKVFIPEPLYICYAHSALVMSVVPGRPLSSWLEEDVLPTCIFRELPGALILAMRALWSAGSLHGDLTFDNILCDADGFRFSLVDPGLRTICTFGDQGGLWSSLSHDLAHTLFDLSISLLGSLGQPAVHRRKWAFVDALVRECVGYTGMPQLSLMELESCIRQHIEAIGSNFHQTLRKQIGLRRSARFFAEFTERRVAML
jgi:tRNA A-37 threonylcarbamoyl transferase component Bud32